jgi:DNA-binding Lrp family transcriptional regulator
MNPGGEAMSRDSALDLQILAALQNKFPLLPRPFAKVAGELAITEERLLGSIQSLIDDRRISRMGAVFDSRRLGYRGTLVAAKVSGEKMKEAVFSINQLSGVTHNYLRDGEYNLWFTLMAPSEDKLDSTLGQVMRNAGIDEYLSLKAVRVFKIDTRFAPGAREQTMSKTSVEYGDPVGLTARDRSLIRALSYPLSLTSEPFREVADSLGLEESQVIGSIKSWLEQGLIRRFGAVIRPTRVGLKGAVLGVWRVDEARAERIGIEMAAFPQVSHCYERITYPEWGYNLYTMIHGSNEEDCRRTAEEISGKTGISEYRLLSTVRELKKTGMRYFEE